MNVLHAVEWIATPRLCCYAKFISFSRKPLNDQRDRRHAVLVPCQPRDARKVVDRIVVEDDPRYRRYPSNNQGLTYRPPHAFTDQDGVHAQKYI